MLEYRKKAHGLQIQHFRRPAETQNAKVAVRQKIYASGQREDAGQHQPDRSGDRSARLRGDVQPGAGRCQVAEEGASMETLTQSSLQRESSTKILRIFRSCFCSSLFLTSK